MNDAMKKQYSIIVEFLGKALGPDYEVVLHDVDDHINSIVAIANGHVSHRSVGGPMTNFGLEVISEERYKKEDYKINYNGISKDQRILRSSTLFIKDEKDEIAGLLCINFDDRRYKALSENILKLCHPDKLVELNTSYDSSTIVDNAEERFYGSAAEEISSVLDKYLSENGIPSDRLSQDDRLHVVDILNQKGIFMVKGAVKEAAKQLACSEPTIYRYINKVNNE
ncbi:helix-turn-helix transcriptional regulator [Sediminispirochaeta smaragdinae]|jgi:predicted transcriptional regulator YheO|uniref:YheO domain protein n=1 Tax=Sediminispirochaeta smaragdinae (strain DSM 11293 / JCM 15392 / SEBR 4228) TaxID=573413 RepID=E1R8E4_SEDSS|nr:helix-turn-helix transcriptional regulator [Sediminispirochaeta smaragdinae]ADK79288.1 YheO domain protein [Sediminispirochaeta smaragdinae DSM 11293]